MGKKKRKKTGEERYRFFVRRGIEGKYELQTFREWTVFYDLNQNNVVLSVYDESEVVDNELRAENLWVRMLIPLGKFIVHGLNWTTELEFHVCSSARDAFEKFFLLASGETSEERLAE